METIRIGSIDVSRFILGGNPISGFSHQGAEVDCRMRHFFSAAQVKRLLREAESLGVNTFLGRADRHMARLMLEHWDEGGQMQWIAQTAPELGSIERGIETAIHAGAKACYVHGGVMDHLLEHGKLDEVPPTIEMIRRAGMPAGVAGHLPQVLQWAEREIDVDFYMCSYYNPSSRRDSPERSLGYDECYSDADRQDMVDIIPTLSKPAIHYKVLAAGRKDPSDAFAFAAEHLRPGDAVCVGVYDEANPNMLREDIDLLDRSLAERR